MNSSGSVPCHARAEITPTIKWTHSAQKLELPAGVTDEEGIAK